MKKVLMILALTLSLVQITMIITINFFENEFIAISLRVANHKVQNELDQEYERMNDNKLLQFGKRIASDYIQNLDDKLEEVKNLVKLESNKLMIEAHAGLLDYQDVSIVAFDLSKFIQNSEFASIYFRSYLLKSLKALRNDLNMMLGTNIFILIVLMFNAVKNYETKLGRGLSWIALTSVILSSFIYFLGQNWLYTLLMNSYYGFIYSVLIGFIFLVLVDLSFNRSRVVKTITGMM